MSKLLDYDHETRTKEVMHFQDDQQVIQSTQDCTDVMAFNKALEGNLDKKADWWLIGSIPLATCMKWAQQSNTRPFSQEWQKYAKRQLNSPDYSKLNPNRVKL